MFHGFASKSTHYYLFREDVNDEVERFICLFSEPQGFVAKELSVQIDHLNLLIEIPPKVSI